MALKRSVSLSRLLFGFWLGFGGKSLDLGKKAYFTGSCRISDGFISGVLLSPCSASGIFRSMLGWLAVGLTEVVQILFQYLEEVVKSAVKSQLT